MRLGFESMGQNVRQKTLEKSAAGMLCALVFTIYFMVSPSSASAATSPEEFYDEYIGKSVDVDNYPAYQPYQCYDLWAQFVMDEYGTSKPIIIGPTGCAQDIWNNFDGLGLEDYFTKVSGSPKDGDWVVFGSTAFSHVAMFRWDNEDGTITVLHQNYLGQTEVTQDKFSTKYVLGYIRPNVYIDDDTDTPEEDLDPVISVAGKEVPVGEYITFNFKASGADGFTVSIYKDGTRIEKKDCGNSKSYTRSFSEPGNYSAYVMAYNDEESAKSKKISFTVVPEYTYTVTDGEARITKYTGSGGNVSIPDKLDGFSVTTIGKRAFLGCKGLTGVTVPEGVTSIGEEAFKDCTGLKSIKLNSGKTTIYNDADTIPTSAKIIGYRNSGGEEYASRYNRTFEAIGTVAQETKPITVMVNGNTVIFDQVPVMCNGRTMVPMRTIFQALGTHVEWEAGKQTVTAKKGSTTIVVKIGDKQATVNGKEKPLDVPAQIINSRTLVPVRFISESLGAEVNWSIGSQTVTINQ